MTRGRLFCGLLFVAVMAQATPTRPDSLIGTTWQLYAIQSMDDAQGTMKISTPNRFTVHFGAEGRVSFQFDCNRGTGNWQAETTAGGAGTLDFGTIAATRERCASAHIGERVARDMVHVRSYLLKDGNLFMSLMADGGIYEWRPSAPAKDSDPAPPAPAAKDNERSVEEVKFSKGASSARLKGHIQGYHYIDYRLGARTGQRLKASLHASNALNYFNILPPDSDGAAMFVGSTSGGVFDGLLPDDGIYTLRVYLMRAGARRNEKSDFSLSVAITGEPLKPVSTTIDAVFPGTPFHALTSVPCKPAYSLAVECEARVIRRSFDGTATVVLRWEKNGLRRILFVKGEPIATDTFKPMTFVRSERGWVVKFGGDEHFEIPEPLVYGG